MHAPETSTGVRRASPSERVDVGLHAVGLDTLLAHLGLEERGVVDSLRARQDLLSPHEEVVRVRVVLGKPRSDVRVSLGQGRASEGSVGRTGFLGSGMV